VIGHPVAHSLSPALHNAAFASLGIDWVYVAHDVAPGAADAALAAMRTLGLGGLSVTMPHKTQVAECVDRLDPAAAALRSVNTVSVADDGALVGHSTDGAGLLASLRAAAPDVSVDGARVVLLGAGGAARAISDAFGRLSIGELVVINRTASSAEVAASLAHGCGRVGTAADITDGDIVVNTTSVGMGTDELPCDPRLLRPGQLVVDIVYHPLRTALLAAAAAAGCRTVDGLGMLVHQAALQQQLWHGGKPDAAVMRAAAEAQLATR
jgi:shikimate dehydrogenase